MIDEKIIERIKKSKQDNESKETVYLDLLNAGFKITDIEAGYLILYQASDEVEARHEEAQQRTIKMVVGFGITLIAAGIFSIIASNWQEFAKLTKILIIYFFLFASYFGGWRLTNFYNLPRLGRSLYYLGSLIFGGGIMLIGQMFNVSSNWPDAFLIWMLGIMSMAYFAEEFGLFFMALPIGLIALVGYPITFFNDFIMFEGHNKLIMTSTLFLLIVSLSTFITGALVRKRFLSNLTQEDNY